ncbi:MAG TPA: ZIP family metal transporter [Candidatus Dormibacteraeota bacterium]|jgi:ZIP family zinc transporter|nr:ZIP family metal transporter [Candidatus Dormibacteraeota bacterium]
MTFAQTAGLGAVAGLTILVGLPVARIGRPRPSRMAFLTAGSVGVLIFLFYDVIKNASQTITGALDQSRAQGIGYGLLLAAGIGAGLMGLVVFERLMKRRRPRVHPGPGAMAAAALDMPPAPATSAAGTGSRRTPLSDAARVALFIAVGIGLHNFSEGLAIGQSGATGAYQLFLVLVIGFGLHNVTEGLGITGPMIGERPSWRFLGLLGIIGGGPTFVGTLIGYQFTSAALSVLFLALAAGAILYVIGELQHVGRKIGAHDIGMLGLLTGFLLAYGTDLVLHAAGA